MEPDLHAEPVGAEERPSSFDAKILVLYGVLRSKVLVLALTGIGLLAGLIAGAAQPNEYASVAYLLYRPGERERLTEELLAGLAPQGSARAPGVLDEVGLLHVGSVYERVARELGPATVLTPPDPGRFDTEDTPAHIRWMHALQRALIARRGAPPADGSPRALSAATRRLRADTELSPQRGSSLIQVVHRAPDAARARANCEAIVVAFQHRHEQMIGLQQRIDQALRQLQEVEAQLSAAREALKEHRKQSGIYDWETEREENRRDLERLELAHDQASGRAEDLAARIAIQEGVLADSPRVIEELVPALPVENPDWRTWRDRELQLEIRMIELRASSEAPASKERRLESLEQELELVSARLAETPPQVEQPPSVRRSLNPLFPELERQLADLRTDRAGNQALLENLERRLGAARERRQVIEAAEDDHRRHRERLEDLLAEREQADERADRLAKMVELESNLSVVEPPALAAEKTGPDRLKPLLAGGFGGLALGIALAALRQLLDPRLRYPETVERTTGARLLAVVPELRRLRGLPERDGHQPGAPPTARAPQAPGPGPAGRP